MIKDGKGERLELLTIFQDPDPELIYHENLGFDPCEIRCISQHHLIIVSPRRAAQVTVEVMVESASHLEWWNFVAIVSDLEIALDQKLM